MIRENITKVFENYFEKFPKNISEDFENYNGELRQVFRKILRNTSENFEKYIAKFR